MISVREIKLGRIEIGPHTPRVPVAVQERMPEYLLAEGDIVVARKGGIERSSYISATESGFFMGSDALRVRLPRDVDSRFIAFQLQTQVAKDWLVRNSTGSTMPSLSGRVLELLPLILPPIEEQRRIAAVLGALDDKIELNRKMNRTLEEMAQALFKSWFIDFDGHEDFVESELGPIPNGWKVGAPTSLVEFDPRVQIEKGAEVTLVEMKAVPTAGPSIEFFERRAFTSGSKFEQGDTLFARITPCLENGKTALVDILANGEPAFGSTEFIVMRGRVGVPSQWVYCLARSDFFRAHAITNMTGSSGRQRVPTSCFEHLFIAVPPPALLERFGEIAGPLFERISINARESRTLAELRDLLLPKLISGELRVPESLDLSLPP